MNTFISILIAAVATTISVQLNKELLDRGIDRSVSLLVSVSLSVLFFEIMRFTMTILPMRFRVCRRVIDPKSKYEGLYIETFDCLAERPISLGVVEYNSESKQYIYTGCAFDKEGNLKAKWNAFDLIVEPGKNTVAHFFTGEILRQASEDVRGYGVLDFNTLTGYFVDSGTNLERHHFIFRKLKRKDFRKYTGKYHRPAKHIWGKIAKACIEETSAI
jgi:hypothetical protein